MAPRDRRPALTTPVAVLAGACVIALAVYLGLRGRAVEPAAPVTPASREGPAPSAAPSPASAPVAAADPSQVEAAARAALAERKPAWVERCWRPFAARASRPARVVYEVDVSFDAQGVQLTYGLQEDREFASADVARCLRDQPLDLRIPAPGAPVRVLLPLELP